MQYMFLIYADGAAWSALDPKALDGVMAEYIQYTQRYVDAGVIVGGNQLQGPEAATTLRVAGAERVVTDGPFVEAKEHVGGYYIVDVADLDAALEVAAELPGVRHGIDVVEIRPTIDRRVEQPS